MLPSPSPAQPELLEVIPLAQGCLQRVVHALVVAGDEAGNAVLTLEAGPPVGEYPRGKADRVLTTLTSRSGMVVLIG
jgi:hypothetical protein